MPTENSLKRSNATKQHNEEPSASQPKRVRKPSFLFIEPFLILFRSTHRRQTTVNPVRPIRHRNPMWSSMDRFVFVIDEASRRHWLPVVDRRMLHVLMRIQWRAKYDVPRTDWPRENWRRPAIILRRNCWNRFESSSSKKMISTNNTNN